MKIDAINFGAFSTPTQQVQGDTKAEKTSSPLDTFDETRFAGNPQVSNPLEQKQGTVEDLMNLQQSTEQMARSYGYSSVAEAAEATSSSAPSGGGESMSVVSAVSGASTSSVSP